MKIENTACAMMHLAFNHFLLTYYIAHDAGWDAYSYQSCINSSFITFNFSNPLKPLK